MSNAVRAAGELCMSLRQAVTYSAHYTYSGHCWCRAWFYSIRNSVYDKYQKALRQRDAEVLTTDSDTVSSLLGPGRVLGKFLSHLGNGLEKQLGLVADKLGYGPLAAYWRLTRGAIRRDEWMEDPDWLLSPMLKTGSRDAQKLIRHVRWSLWNTRYNSFGLSKLIFYVSQIIQPYHSGASFGINHLSPLSR